MSNPLPPTRRSTLASLAASITTGGFLSMTQTSDAQAGAKADYTSPSMRLALTIWVQIGALEQIGDIPGGEGRVIPITGGEFEGSGMSGIVLPGGADWQTLRPDGVLELRAHYGIKTDDGVIIQVKNNVLVPPRETGRRPRSVIELKAPAGPYDWLNKSVFVGTLNDPADPRAPVTIRCFVVE